jgi:hypothetical protein
VNPEECTARIHLVDEYSRLVTKFNHLVESLKSPFRERNEEVWRRVEEARRDSQSSWDALEKHIAEHKCIDLPGRSTELIQGVGSGTVLERAALSAMPQVKPPGTAVNGLIGALIEELADNLPDDLSFETVRAELLGANRARDADKTLRFYLLIKRLLRDRILLQKRLGLAQSAIDPQPLSWS